MSVSNDSVDLSKKLKQINSIYKNAGKQNLSEILESFSCISKGYIEASDNVEFGKYSSKTYNECTEEEKERFFNDQLQMIECLVTNSVYDKVGEVWNWRDIYNLVYDADYARVEKGNRKVVFSTSSMSRPIGNIAWQMWNGLQIIDLDIKDERISSLLKVELFNDLSKFHWFLGICKSASKKSLHVWTKITPISFDPKDKRTEFLCNFRHKYSYVYMVLLKNCDKIGYTKDNIISYMDMAMAKPQQGIFISSDDAMMSTDFQDLRLDVNFESAFDNGVESVDWISHQDLKAVFSKLDWFMNDDFDKTQNIKVESIEASSFDPSISHGSKHYKHAQRWQLANTLTSLFGEQEAFRILSSICKDTPLKELRGDIKTAKIHDKPVSIWAIKELNSQHGFSIKIKDEEVDKTIQRAAEEMNSSSVKVDPIKILNSNLDKVVLKIKKDQYLSDIKDDIINNLSHITLLEAGAGYGKTEMIKSLKAKTLLILPFTSTIRAKVEVSQVTKDWMYFYGNKRPMLQDILGSKSMSMTIDKFSRLNVYELDMAQFEYIVIDESHLLFTSSYRDVMGPCIQRLANCKAKVLMMTGTPTGEMLFFPNIKYIKVEKEDLRVKECIINIVPTETEQILEMCKSMADDVMHGVKILFPTNKGMLYYEQIRGIIQKILDERHYVHELKTFYYKKSKYGEDSMEDINTNKTVGDNDIIFCSTYLSVGVDICDNLPFTVHFSKTLIPQDIEQFANRLRNNDLYIRIWLPATDSSGMPIDYKYVKPLDLSFNQEDLMFARDLAKTANDMLERNNEESKYNPLISSILNTEKWLKYDENDCKYYIDETTYKLKVFEERYSDYSKQLEVMKQGLIYYGYDVKMKYSDQRVTEKVRDDTEEFMKSCRSIKFNNDTAKVRMFLNHVNDGNIDQYRELLRGNYSIFKDKDENSVHIREENGLYVEDIEILEKHTPIVLSLYKNYDCDTIRDIYEYCIDKRSNRLNFAKLKRVNTFVKIDANRRKKRLDMPVMRMVVDFQKWAREHPKTTQHDIDRFLAEWTCKWINSISDLVVEDRAYLEEMFEIVKEYWSVIVIHSRPSNSVVDIAPFELIWKTKQQLSDAYGDMNTQTFFLEQLIGEVKEDDASDANAKDEEQVQEFDRASKIHLRDIIDEIPSIVHSQFDYFDYSKRDMSNDRFLLKQKNTNALRDDLFAQMDDSTDKAPSKSMMEDMFGSQDTK